MWRSSKQYSIIQDEPAAGGNGNRRRKSNSGSIDPTTKAVVRRIETWAFTGRYDPITHETLCVDLLCNAPAADEIGPLLDVQMTAANVQPDALFVAKTGSGNVDGSDKLISCGSKCVQPYNAGTVVTLTAKPASGYSFSGWSGACAGTNLTCVVTVNGDVQATANFVVIPKTGGGGGGGTTSFSCLLRTSMPARSRRLRRATRPSTAARTARRGTPPRRSSR